MKFLGHLINKNGISPDPDKIRAITQFPIPKSVKQVRSFLGICSYYRRFIKSFTEKARPLNLLIRDNTKFFWAQEQEDAFNTLKSALTAEPILGHFDENATTELHTDASGFGIGAVLVQIQEGIERVIAYASRVLSKAEINYSTTERECLAVVWSISKFRPYIYGRPFSVVTDHHALCWLTSLKDPSGRLARWSLRLQEHDITVLYRSGHKHLNADCLSRNPVPNIFPDDNESKILSVLALEDFNIEQKQDPSLVKIFDNLEKEGEFYTKRGFKIIDGILYKKNYDPSGKRWLIVIPKQLRKDILKGLHDAPTAGHLSFSRTYDRVRKTVFWPGLYRSVRKYVAHCRDCQRRKAPSKRPTGHLQSIPPSYEPLERVGIDLLGRFPLSNMGNRWIVVCTDYLTRYAITKALPEGTSLEVAKFIMEDIILKHGAPRTIISDRGKAFQSKLIKQIVQLWGTIHNSTSSYHPQTNGLTERLNKTLADMLSMYVDVDQRNWDAILPFITFAYNTSKQESTKFSPFFLIHGREATTTLETCLPCPNEDTTEPYIDQLICKIEDARKLARIHTLEAQSKDKRIYDACHREVMYYPGELVWIFTPVRKVGVSEKLLRRYFGPYRIVKQMSTVTYEVQALDTNSRRRINNEVVHVLRMKPYNNPDDQLETFQESSEENLVQEVSCETSNDVYKGPITRSRTKKLA